MKNIFVGLMVCFLILSSSDGYTYPITGPYEFNQSGGCKGGNLTAFIKVGIGENGWINIPLFAIASTDIGNTFILNAGTTFDSAATALTDGNLDGIYVELNTVGSDGSPGGGFGIGKTEPFLFYNQVTYPPTPPIDLQGFSIMSISATLTDFHSIETYKELGRDIWGSWTDFDYSVSLNIEFTQVPLPPTILLLGSGLLGLAGWRRLRKG
jgi:hypothetical protein